VSRHACVELGKIGVEPLNDFRRGEMFGRRASV
jgi:hypothetical protein